MDLPCGLLVVGGIGPLHRGRLFKLLHAEARALEVPS